MGKTITTTKTIEDSSAVGAEPLPAYRRPFWEIIAGLTPEDWQNHKARVYFATEAWLQDTAPEGNVFQESFDEDTIRNKWGGGRYLIWLYGPPECRKVVCPPFKLSLAGTRKHISNGNGNGASSDIVAVLNLLIDELRSARGGATTEKAMQSALDLQATALKSGVQTVRELNTAPGTPAEKSRLENILDKLLETMILRMAENKPDPLQEALQKAMIDRLINPTNPIDQVKQIVEGIKPLLGGFGSGKTDLGQLANTFLGNLPSLANKAVEGVREYRLANESAERVIKLQVNHGLNHGDVINVEASGSTQEPAAASRGETAAAPVAAAPQAGQPEDVHGPSLEWVQLKIVDAIEKNPQAAGEWLYSWLEAVAPELNQQLAPMTAAQIMDIFRTQPILSKVATHPELPKIIETYLAEAKEASAAKPS